MPFEGRRDLTYLKEFMRYKSPEFDGRMDPLAAEDWVWKAEKILNTLNIMTDAYRICLATHQLDSKADQWCRDKQDTVNTRRLTWRDFKKLFFDKYFPPMEREKKEEEFKELM